MSNNDAKGDEEDGNTYLSLTLSKGEGTAGTQATGTLSRPSQMEGVQTRTLLSEQPEMNVQARTLLSEQPEMNGTAKNYQKLKSKALNPLALT